MKKILVILSALAIIAACSQKKEEIKDNGKKAILMVHFGTTHDDTRALTIDAVNAKVKEAFPECDVFEAYTSNIVIKKLNERGIEKQTPMEVLEKLHNEGYKTVRVQPTHIIPGKEYKELLSEVEEMKSLFSDLSVGNPLLYSVKDTRAVIDILGLRHKTDSPSHHILLVGHGTDDPANAMYCQADYMFQAKDYSNFHVATIEGFPSIENAFQVLKNSGAKSVTLVPFMFVAGDHAANDISVEWKEAMENLGLKVDVKMEGLGQVPEIQDLFIQHLN
ncbi:MAG: sirohydrochlorin cobaltochelatase [Bacteroidales bacterium]|nr:sirohydrochlorin cobaltochelatase [Bacteroidales bacterium]